MSMDLSLDALAAFEAVARHGSFTAAARELCVTQGAVSHRVRALEDKLGVTLLHRTTRHTEPTEDGAILAAAVSRGLEAIQGALQKLAERGRQEHVAVSCSPSFAIRWLVRHLHDLSEAHPEITVRIAAEDQLVAPGREGIDSCIRFGAGSYRGFAVTRLTHEEVVARPALLAIEPLHKLADLEHHLLLHHDVLRDHPENVDWRRWLAGTKVQVDPERGPRFSHAHLALEAALAGQGVALGRRTLVADDLAAGRLVSPLRRKVPSGLAYHWVTTTGPLRPAVRRFGAWLAAALEGSGAS